MSQRANTLLVIDDDAMLRSAMRLSLQREGFNVEEAGDAETGLRLAEARTPDLVLCDVQMAGMNGFALLSELRHKPGFAGVPVILMTGDETLAGFAGQRTAMDLGADDFLAKPFDVQNLLTAVTARLERRQAQRRAFAAGEERWRGILEATTDVVALAQSPSTRLAYLNPAGRAFLGLSGASAVETLTLADLCEPAARACFRDEVLAATATQGRWEGVFTFHDRLGESVPVALTLLAQSGGAGQSDYFSLIAHDLRSLERIEQALRESETRFRAIATAASDAIIMMDPEGRVSFWNSAATRIFGYAEEEAVGRRVHELIAPPGLRGAYEEAFPRFQATGAGAAIGRVVNVQGQRKDGSTFAAELSLASVDLGGRWHAVGIARDVTQQQQTTQTLMRERILLRTLMDALPDSIYAKDRDARKTLANRTDVKFLGAASEEAVLGKTDHEFLNREAAAACHADDLRVILRGEPVLNREELIVNPAGEARWLETTKLPLRDEMGQIIGLVGIGHDITERRRTDERLRKLSCAVEQSPAGVVITDTTGAIEYVNPKFCALTGYTPAEVLGQNPRVLKSGETPAETYRELWQRLASGQEWRGEFHNRKKNGELYWEFAVLSPIKDDAGRITHYLAVKEDITERKRREQEKALLETHLRQAQKLESIGQLAAGIAHEINTPMQYIGDNTRFLQDAFADLRRVVGAFQGLTERLQGRADLRELLEPIETLLRSADVDYLVAEIPRAIGESLQGVERVTKIVRAMKEFSHPGTDQKTLVDLNHAIESTVTVARNEWKYVADLETDFDPQLPQVPCLPGEFNQVILNLIINAAHAIADVVGREVKQKGKITIRTRRQPPWAEIRVADTGTGIPEAVRGRIFDPFFTTKSVGKGTGQGLTIAHSVIVDKHGGTIHFETETGRGTTFILCLPLAAATAPAPPTAA